jgi:hypothetical protein
MSDERPVGGLGGRHGDDFTGRQTGERRSGEADGARVDSEGDAGRRADTDPGDAGQRRPGPRPRSSAERFGLSDLDSDRAALARRRGAGGTNPARPDSFRDAANAARGAADLMRGGAGAGRAAGLGRRPVVPPQAEPRSTDRRPPVDDAEVPSDEDDQPFAGLAEQVRAAGSGALGPGTPGRRPDSGLNPAADSGAPGTGARAPEPPPTAETA